MTTPQDGTGGQEPSYNTGLQIMGLFLILFLSALGCMFPLVVKRCSWIPIPRRLLFFSRHLGTGVIIATCFVHLVPTAFENLHDPSLPSFWTEEYPAMAGLIMMIGVLIIGAIEYFFTSHQFGHSHHSEFTDLDTGDSRIDNAAQETTQETAREVTPETITAPTPEALVERTEMEIEEQSLKSGGSDASQRQLMQCALLEAGILFHSIFIGMAVAFSSGKGFVVLLIAISFHQIFEGLALGSRIAAIERFGPKSWKPWVMALCYGVTAPAGQAIGLGVHRSFDLESQRGLLTVGIANAFSRYAPFLLSTTVQMLLTLRTVVCSSTRDWCSYSTRTSLHLTARSSSEEGKWLRAALSCSVALRCRSLALGPEITN